ncbi:MAG: hypothetical protein NZ551_10395 [Microscillaceae bacterium]|nr:hypothetical protein [Microscillaceae bacterium]MDW8461607.1 hypothetical protein [Cytophagales bacterium]
MFFRQLGIYFLLLAVLFSSVGVPVWRHSCQTESIVNFSFTKPTESCCSIAEVTDNQEEISDSCCTSETNDNATCETNTTTENASTSPETESELDEHCCKNELKIYQVDFQNFTYKKIGFLSAYWVYLPKHLIFVISWVCPTASFLAKTSFLQTKSPPQMPQKRTAFLQVFLI